MIKINDVSEIKDAFSLIEENGEEWHTNLLESDEEVIRWINKGQVSMLATDKCVFIVRKRYGCQRIYFACSEANKLSSGLIDLFKEKLGVLIIKLLTRNAMQDFLKNEITAAGFEYYTSLKRVTKVNNSGAKKHKQGDFADAGDFPKVKEIIRSNFDSLLDQWPDDDEISRAIDENRILVARDSTTKQVIAIQSFERVGMTLYGRYLASLEEYRNRMAYGPILWRQCIKLNPEAKRIVGWIDKRNELAIKVNLSMGFVFDGICEEVFIFR